jgi:hypothetical protein
VRLKRKSRGITVSVRWFDGYGETFTGLDEVRFSAGLLWLAKGDTNRHIPLARVRWYSVNPESHMPPLDS